MNFKLRNMFKMYLIGDLKKSTNDFNRVQAILNGYDIKFNVVFFKDDKIGIIAFGIEEGSENDDVLKRNGFDTKGV